MLRLAGPIGASSRRRLLVQAVASQRRHFAERKDSTASSDSPAPVKQSEPLGSGSPAGPASKLTSPAAPSSSSSIPPESVPSAPPSPKVQTSPPTTAGASSPPETKPPSPPAAPGPAAKKRRSGFRALLYLILASGLAYGGGVFYALQSDNFHDFFTEYVPFGEDAVLYFEERSFQKRFPNAKHQVYRTPHTPKEEENKVTIPRKSGLSWRVAEEEDSKGSDLTQKGKHMSALDANQPSKRDAANAKSGPAGATPVEAAKKDSTLPQPPQEEAKDVPTKPLPDTGASVAPTPGPQTEDQPSVIALATAISPLEVPSAEEPVVHELVKIVNDLITVVNSDSAEAASKYSAPVSKAKESLAGVASKISALRDAERQAAEERVQQAHKEFDEGAKQLLQRIEAAQREDEARYREEFEAERAKLALGYEEKLKTEIERTTELGEQRLRNELVEQAIELKRNFGAEIRSLVESEREGRLSKLYDLSTNVDNLTQLTSNWNGVIDANLATQKLQVAVDAVRSTLSNSTASDATPKPFVREMAALKLVADGDPVVDAAIASINPAAYQRGIPSQSQLIDRFRRVASEVRKASLLPENAGVASHAASVVLSKVMFKKHGQPQGNDVESILTRTETLLEEGDLDAAAREMNGLQGWAKVLSRDWLGDARKVLEVKQALDVIETEARLQCLRVE